MGEAVTIQVQFDGFGSNKPVTFNARDWWVHETNGVQLLTIQDKESSETTHDIPLASVLYWSTKPCDDAGLSAFDRYCDTCKIYFSSDHYSEHPIQEHDVRRVCCGSSPQRDHHPSCTAGDFSSQQRIGTIVDIHDDNGGLKITAKIDDPNNPASPLFAVFKPDPNQPGVG